MSFGITNRINIFNKKKIIQGNYIYDPSFANQIFTKTGEGNFSNLNISNNGLELTATTKTTVGKLYSSSNNGGIVSEERTAVDGRQFHCSASDFSLIYFPQSSSNYLRKTLSESFGSGRTTILFNTEKMVCSKNGLALLSNKDYANETSAVVAIQIFDTGSTTWADLTQPVPVYRGNIPQYYVIPTAMAVSSESNTNYIAMVIYETTPARIYIITSSSVTGADSNTWTLYNFNKRDAKEVALTNISNNVVTAFIACGGSTNPGLWKMTFNRTDNNTTRTTNLNNSSYFTNITPNALDNVFQSVAVSTDGNYIVASSTTKIYCSRDGGSIWNVCANYPAISIALSEKGHHAMIATNSTGNTSLYNFLRLSRPIT